MKHLFKIISVAIVALAASVGLWIYLNGSLTKSKAAQETATVSFAPGTRKVNDGAEASVNVIISMSGGASLSGLDLSFTTNGEGLEFSRYILPTGFTDQILDAAKVTTDIVPKKLNHLVFIANKASANLPKSATIPLYFKAVVPNNDRSATPEISVNVNASQAVGPGGKEYWIVLDPTAPSFKVSFNPLPSDSATGLECDMARNTSRSNCGQAVAFTWNDATNEDKYEIYRNGTLISTELQNAISFNDKLCNLKANVYAVKAINAGGTKDITAPTVSCACQICPTPLPPTPSPVPPSSSADLLLRLVFPDAAATVNQITDVKITVFDNAGKSICKDGVDCKKIVSFQRDTISRTPNTFSSPRLRYDLEKNQAYTIVVKQPHTIQQTYKRVYLTWTNILQCLEGTSDSRCGDLISEVDARPLLSGDLDNSNKIDQADLEIVNKALGLNSGEGDLDFDKKTDQKDANILPKNFDKSGT